MVENMAKKSLIATGRSIELIKETDSKKIRFSQDDSPYNSINSKTPKIQNKI